MTLALSVIAAKALALLIGANGVGLLALMQSLLNLGVILASVGLGTSVIRATASAASHGKGGPSSVERAGLLVGLGGGAIGAAGLVVFREPIAVLLLGSVEQSFVPVVLAPALLLTVAGGVQIAVLTGLHRIRTVAGINIGTSVAAAALGVSLVAIFGGAGLAPALLVTAAVQITLSRIALSRGHALPRESGSNVIPEAAHLFWIGLPIQGSQLAGIGAQLLIPIVVLNMLSTLDVGHYRAASAISIGYLTVFLSMMMQDYLPRVSAASSPLKLATLVERRMRLVMGLGIPVILMILATGPFLMELLYSPEFVPAYEVLKWQLIGDLVRLPAWVLVFGLLARGRGFSYFSAELIGGSTLIAGTIIAVEALGLAGAGIGYAMSQAIYYVGVWLLVRPHVPTGPGRLQIVTLAIAAASSLLLASGLDPIVTSVWFGLAAIASGAVAWPRLYALHRGGEL